MSGLMSGGVETERLASPQATAPPLDSTTFSSRGREASAGIGRNEDSPMKPCGHTANWRIKALAKPGVVIRGRSRKSVTNGG